MFEIDGQVMPAEQVVGLSSAMLTEDALVTLTLKSIACASAACKRAANPTSAHIFPCLTIFLQI